MNFLKGFVDGILADDVDRGQVTDVFQQSFSGESQVLHEEPSYDQDAHSRKLGDIYKEERKNCITSLLIRYGEANVQQLNELLKSNNDTVNTLAKQLDEAYRSLGDFNNELESLTQENVKLRRKNTEVSDQMEQLRLENVNLKTIISHAEIEAKSKEERITELSALLKENAATFDQMKARCESLAGSATEIAVLKQQLDTANSHINALTKERDSLLNSTSDPDNRIKEAKRRQERAIAIAKLMAQETIFLTAEKENTAKPAVDNLNHTMFAEALQATVDLKAQVEHLKEENSDLKDMNVKMHNMLAELSNKSSKLQESYLMEAIETLGKRHLKQLKPVQLIFIKPTGVLDLDLDLELVSSEMSSVIKKVQPSATFTVNKEAPRVPESREDEFTFLQKESGEKIATSFDSIESMMKRNSKISSTEEPKKKEAWGTDWDIYEEILQEAPKEPEKTNQKTGHSDITLNREGNVMLDDKQESMQSALAELPVASQREEVQPAVASVETDATLAKAEPAKPKTVWDDDLDDLLKDE